MGERYVRSGLCDVLYALAAFHHAFAAPFESLQFSRHSACFANASPASMKAFSTLKAAAACSYSSPASSYFVEVEPNRDQDFAPDTFLSACSSSFRADDFEAMMIVLGYDDCAEGSAQRHHPPITLIRPELGTCIIAFVTSHCRSA